MIRLMIGAYTLATDPFDRLRTSAKSVAQRLDLAIPPER
jgi:hypothetical protein